MPVALSTQWEILFVPKNFWTKEGASFQLRRKKKRNVYFTKLRTEPESHKSKSTHAACGSAKLLPRKSKAGGPQGFGWQWQGYQGLPACIWKLSHELFLGFVGFVFVQNWALSLQQQIQSNNQPISYNGTSYFSLYSFSSHFQPGGNGTVCSSQQRFTLAHRASENKAQNWSW